MSRNLFKYHFLLGLLIILFGCSEEEDIPASQKIFESREIVYSELSFSVKEKLATVKSVWNNTRSNQFELEANAFNPLDGLFLIQDQGIVQQHLPSGTEYYTFPLIRRQNQNEFLENFVLVQRENQILGEYLIQYDFEHDTKPRVTVLENGSYHLLSNQAANPSGDTGCYELQPNAEVYENWTAEDFGFFGVDSAGYTWVVVACPNGGGSVTFSDDTCDGCFGEEPVTGEPNNNNGNLGGGGDDSNIENTPPVLTTSPTTITGSGSQFGSVNITSIVETINTILNNSLSTEEQNLLLSNTKLTVTILNYLSETNFSNDAKEFVNDVIDVSVEVDYTDPNFTQDNYPGKEDGLPFEWWEDEEWIDSNIDLNIDQDPIYDKLTEEEKTLIKIYPTLAYFMSKNKAKAEAETIDRFGADRRNDKADAFRHATFNALNTRSATTAVVGDGGTVVRKFGEAHENFPNNHPLTKAMDLFNNDRGIEFCSDCVPFFTTDEEVYNGVMELLENGALHFISPLNILDEESILPNSMILPTDNPQEYE